MVSPLCMSIGKWKKPWKTKLLLNSVLYNTCLLENYLTYDGNQKTCLFLLKTFWSGCHINQENKRNQKAKHLKKGADGNQKKSRVLHEFKTDHFSHHFPYRFSLFWFFWFHIVILISEMKRKCYTVWQFHINLESIWPLCLTAVAWAWVKYLVHQIYKISQTPLDLFNYYAYWANNNLLDIFICKYFYSHYMTKNLI